MCCSACENWEGRGILFIFLFSLKKTRHENHVDRQVATNSGHVGWSREEQSVMKLGLEFVQSPNTSVKVKSNTKKFLYFCTIIVCIAQRSGYKRNIHSHAFFSSLNFKISHFAFHFIPCYSLIKNFFHAV